MKKSINILKIPVALFVVFIALAAFAHITGPVEALSPSLFKYTAGMSIVFGIPAHFICKYLEKPCKNSSKTCNKF